MKIDRLGKIFFISLIIILTLHSLAFAANKTSVSASKNLEHAFSIPAKLSLTYTDSTFTKKGGISVQSDDYDIDGRNSAVFLSNGAKLTLTGTSTITTTSANHSHGIYVYKNDANDTTAILNGTAITINSDYSAGVMANGGIISADSVKITTSGDSSPAVRVGYNDSDVKISNSTLVTKGKNSPVIMFNSLNSPSEITISKSTLTATHSSSDIIAVKDNSQAAINFSGVTFGGTVSVDENSTLTINLKNKSTFSGKIKTSGDVTINIEAGSTWKLTGNSYVSSLENNGQVISNDYAVFVDGSTESKDIINYIAPTITTSSLKTGNVGTYYETTLKATGTEPIKWSIYSGSLPDGLELDEDTGEISGTPTTIKSYSFVVQAENEAGTATKGLTINIAKALISPTITTTELTTATVNKNYSFTLKATGTTPIKWSADVLPDGMTLTADGVFKGKPTAIGEYQIKFTALNATEVDDDKTLTFKVNGISPTISGTVPNGLIGSEYLATFTIIGESLDVTTNEDLPAGLSFEVSGDNYVLTGIPTEEWNKKFTVTAKNDWGTVSKIYDLIIKAVKPKFLTSSLASGDIASTYSSDVKYEGTIPTITITGLPAGITSSDNGNAITLSGTPTKSGTFTVRVTLKNSAGSVSKSFKMIIYEAPTIITTSYDVTINSNFSLTLKATGTTPIKWEPASNCPVTLTSLGVLKGKLTSTGTNTFTITATNSAGSDTKTFILTGKNPKPTLTGTVKQGYVDVDYSATFKANGNGDITITCDSTLPAGLTFTDSGDKTASITGTPTETFKDKISVTAMTSDGVTTTKIFTLNVKEIKPTIVTKALNSGMIGENYENGIEVTGSKPISVTVAGLPEGLDYEPDTGRISGMPKQSGKFTVKIVAKNNIGTATKSLKLNIYAPPAITQIDLP
ncbi:MAG: putative Ig domain-containing protein, partial [Synergistaceae bacterium]|nr:putative Ig domain-containing protein [Synergistaceae bacterium]